MSNLYSRSSAPRAPPRVTCMARDHPDQRRPCRKGRRCSGRSTLVTRRRTPRAHADPPNGTIALPRYHSARRPPHWPNTPPHVRAGRPALPNYQLAGAPSALRVRPQIRTRRSPARVRHTSTPMWTHNAPSRRPPRTRLASTGAGSYAPQTGKGSCRKWTPVGPLVRPHRRPPRARRPIHN